MKIAISDFDGTLCQNFPGVTLGSGVSKENIQAVKRWQKAGNKFGIATGRSLNLIEWDLAKYDFEVDFLVCDNGGTAFDEKRNLLYSRPIPREILKKLLETPPFKNENIPLMVFGERQVYAFRSYPDVGVELAPIISAEELAERDDIVQFGMKFDSSEAAQKACDDFLKNFPMLSGNPNRIYLDMNMSQVDKTFGIERLLEKMNWQNCEVLTIGDEKNDIPMIKKFKGFAVKNASEDTLKAARKIYETVGQMLNDNL